MLDLAWQSRVLEAYHNTKLVKNHVMLVHLPTGVFIGHGYFNICTKFVPFYFIFSLNVTPICLWVINVDLGWEDDFFFFFLPSLSNQLITTFLE